ncbi:MAG: hypothetical protein HY717_21605 [Planctomycetes bacterium]|nr:hypothetical protein [Planctomycetota bacterium]
MKTNPCPRYLLKVFLFSLPMFSGCSAGPETRDPGSGGDEKPDASAGLPVIGHLVMRHGMITIYSSGQGPRFAIAGTAHDRPGTALTLEELEAQYPSVHLMYKSSIAWEGPILDASLWPREQLLSHEAPATENPVLQKSIPFAGPAPTRDGFSEKAFPPRR